MGRKKAAARKAETPATVNGTDGDDFDAYLETLDLGEFERDLLKTLNRLHEMGAFRSPYYDRLLERKPLGITLEDVEKLPY